MTNSVNISSALTDEEAMGALVARRIHALREKQRFTFDELSRRSGVSKGTLVQIEQGAANPSISTLCKLASALGSSVADIVSIESAKKSAVTIVKPEGARRLWTGTSGGSATLLAGSQGPDMLEFWQWELKPGERFEAAAHSHGTRELIHVASGRLALQVSGEEVIVTAGATAVAQTDKPHSYSNPGKIAVRFFMTVQEPSAAP